MKNTFNGPGDGCDEYRKAVETIEEARREWSDIPGEIRGRTLEETFLRGVKVLLGEALITEYLESLQYSEKVSDDQRRKHLKEIIATGEWLVESFKRHPRPLEANSPDERKNNYYTHYARPMEIGHSLLAFGHFHISPLTSYTPPKNPDGRKAPITHDPALLSAAVVYYAKAAGWALPDSTRRSNWLWYAILTMMQRGGFYLGDLNVLRDMAEKTTTWFTPFFESNLYDKHPGKEAIKYLDEMVTKDKLPAPAVIGPYISGPKDMVYDSTLMGDFTEVMTKMPEYGLLIVTEVMRDVWRERVEVYGERPEEVGGNDIWGQVDPRTRKEWETMLPIAVQFAKEEGQHFFPGGWLPPAGKTGTNDGEGEGQDDGLSGVREEVDDLKMEDGK